MAWEGKDDVGGLVRMREIQGKGRGVVAAQPLKAGQIVLTDSPILLYSAFPFEEEAAAAANNYCSNCFRLISIQQSTTTTTTTTTSVIVIVGCPGCSCDFFFCSPKCQSIGMSSSSSSSHPPWVCQSLCRLRPLLQHHPLDLQLQARFLIAAYNLPPSHFQTLLSLQGSSSSSVDDPNNNNNNSLFLHSLISSHSPPPPHLSAAAVEFCPQLTAALLAKDKLNAFGLMEPFSEEKFGYRSVRAYGIYPRASFFNHDCLPNACRFDYLDHQSSTSTPDLIIRMIHDVPQGREICLSYFPVNLNYSDRQRRLRDDYGFTCDCDRCKVEANWSDHEPMDDDDDDDDDNDEDCDQDMLGEMDSETESSGRGGLVKEDNNDDDFPHAYFFLRYMCNRNNCWGTLAPLPPTPTPTPDHHSPTPSTVLECNVCGNFHVTPEE